ncbi:MAG: DUF2950 domain-containing protein [Acidobacteriaceae bacterium]|nr:DUF2950 domain-containing protein [Acidobacteriaceae bacterium]MBV8572936.1 DUF2950 domain-containing protein [Acidobacteriaceae bacterium]
MRRYQCVHSLLPNFFALAVVSAMAGHAFAVEQKTFSTPQQAISALVKAAADNNTEEVLAIFGDDGRELVYSGDAVQDRARLQRFVTSYRTKHGLVEQDANTMFVTVGPNDWPMPIPIVNEGGKWRFDTAAGKNELLYRRIGNNELGAIAVCRGYIDAQQDYAKVGHDGLPAGIYAQKLMSTPGKQDGLYWETKEGEPSSPAGPLLAEATGGGYDAATVGSKAQPYHGYLYRILKAQGPAAAGGAKSYLLDGKLTGGIGLVAYPAEYRVSGVMTFIVNQDGIVYEKNLGERTGQIAGTMSDYNPDSTWMKVPQNE